MKRVAETEQNAIVEIPAIVGIRPIVVEPQLTVIVALHIEDVRVTVRVRIVRRAVSIMITAIEYSPAVSHSASVMP